MGNRAVITTRNALENDGLGVYLHWNGGRDSVEGFLKYCEIRSFASPENSDYGWARLTQVISNFMDGDGLSVGVEKVSKLDQDNFDNGTYVIEKWKIVDRLYLRGEEQNAYQLREFIVYVDEHQPEEQKIGKDLLETLFDNNLTISDVDTLYNYRVNKTKGLPMEEGKSYRSENGNDRVAKVIELWDREAIVQYGDDYHLVPRFRWRNGTDSFNIISDGKTLQFTSMKEVI